MWVLCERTQCSQQYFSQTLCRLHAELNGALGGITEAFWGVVRLKWNLALSSSCAFNQEDAWGVGSSTILGGVWQSMSGAARAWLNSWWHDFRWLLSRCHLGETWSNCRAGALSVALPGTTSVQLWSVQRSPLLQDQTSFKKKEKWVSPSVLRWIVVSIGN